jgi:uncharacterized protein
MPSSDPRTLISPCVGICMLDEDGLLCRGCLRSMAEIAGWMRFTDEEKIAVLESCEGRRAERKKARGKGRGENAR